MMLLLSSQNQPYKYLHTQLFQFLSFTLNSLKTLEKGETVEKKQQIKKKKEGVWRASNNSTTNF